MTICLVIRGSEGIVLAADSRTTAIADMPFGGTQLVPMDNTAVKLFSFKEPNTAIGVVIHGSGAIDQKPLSTYIPDFEATLPAQRLTIQDFAQQLSDFFMRQWKTLMPTDFKGPDISFIVAGFGANQLNSKVLSFDIPGHPQVVEKKPDIKNEYLEIFLGGRHEFIDRLIRGFDPELPKIIADQYELEPQEIQSLEERFKKLEPKIILKSLQEHVDLAAYLVKTTIDAEKLLVPWRQSCGGETDIATITWGNPLQFVQRKKIADE